MDTQHSPRAAKRLEMLARLADLAQAIAERVAAIALTEPEPTPEVVLAYTRISRCVRQTLACEARLEQSAILANPEAARNAARQARAARRRPHIRREVERVIAYNQGSDAENLLLDLEERLNDADLLQAIATAPLEDIVLQLCEELGIHMNASEMSDEALLRDALRYNPDYDPEAEPPYDPTEYPDDPPSSRPPH